MKNGKKPILGFIIYHIINKLYFYSKKINVNKVLKTPKEMFTITPFTAGGRRA
jgi:hypothetical protein